MTVPIAEKPFRIDIIGGGVAGCLTAILLQDTPGLQVTVYERSAEGTNVGSAIGVSEVAEKYLNEILGTGEFQKVVKSVRAQHEVHFKTGEKLFPGYAIPEGRTCMRVEFHQLLMSKLRPKVMRYLAKAMSTEKKGEVMVTTFADGSVSECDLLVVSDGYRSKMLASLGIDTRLYFAERVQYNRVIPRSMLTHIPNLPTEAKRYHDGNTWLQFSPIAGPNSDTFSLTAAHIEAEVDRAVKSKWGEPAPAHKMAKVREYYKNFKSPIPEVLASLESTNYFPIYRSKGLDTLIKDGRCAVIGDAAHALGGLYAMGATFAVGDAKTLHMAIAHTLSLGQSLHDPSALAETLEIYNDARCPLFKKVFECVEKTYEFNAVAEKIEDDDERVAYFAQEAPKHSSIWMRNQDVVANFERVLETRGARKM